ncbi:MAG: haloacid dehalogenase type II [Chloroflexota bacterium]
MAARSVILVFDVNETLLDLSALDGPFEQVFGDAAVRREWFGQLLQSALVSTVTDAYADFGSVGRAALTMVAQRRGRELTEPEIGQILGTVKRLPPHPEVPDALQRLRDGGFRLATLTNSTEPVVQAQLEHAGLTAFFERTLSADATRRLKPAPEAYRLAARELEIDIGQMRVVAAHAWDVAGALRAGCLAAFVARPGMVLDPLAPSPDVVGADMTEVAAALLQGGSA